MQDVYFSLHIVNYVTLRLSSNNYISLDIHVYKVVNSVYCNVSVEP